MPVSLIQDRFDGGEISERIRGRFGSDTYKKSLAFDENFIPKPQGSLLMRAGTKATGFLGAARLIPFNVSNGEPFGLVLNDLKLEILDYLGVPVSFYTNLIHNGQFDSGWASWDGIGFTWETGGFIRVPYGVGPTKFARQQGLWWVTGHNYHLHYKARGVGTVRINIQDDGSQDFDQLLTPQWHNYSQPFTIIAADAHIQPYMVTFTPITADVLGVPGTVDIDDVFVVDDADPGADHVDAPWTGAQIPFVQYDQDLTKNRMMLVHGNQKPQLLSVNTHGFWEIKNAEFTGAPTSWGHDNYPSTIDWGFQGRLWLGATPDEPNVFNGSKSGYPFDFTLGALASDGLSFTASVRGAIQWMQGQKSLLMGAERAEQAVSGGGSIVTPNNVNVEDESAFGSAPVQAAHLGDEVVFVGRNRREVRALSFDAQVKNGWVSKALSFIGEHLVHDIKEIHFARSPDPLILVLLGDGHMVACTYDRGEQVVAWWRVRIGGWDDAASASIVSAAVVETLQGSELWLAVLRAGGVGSESVEILPLHEVGLQFLDSYSTGVVPVDGLVTGLERIANYTVQVLIDGAVSGAMPVTAGGAVQLDPADAGKTYVIGLKMTATATLLPRDIKSGKAHSPKVGVLLNRSALPTLNGYLPADRVPATPLDLVAPLRSGKFDVAGRGWSDEDQITIKQDKPFRTEILAVYSRTQANET